jgi:hypothetical protein
LRWAHGIMNVFPTASLVLERSSEPYQNVPNEHRCWHAGARKVTPFPISPTRRSKLLVTCTSTIHQAEKSGTIPLIHGKLMVGIQSAIKRGVSWQIKNKKRCRKLHRNRTSKRKKHNEKRKPQNLAKLSSLLSHTILMEVCRVILLPPPSDVQFSMKYTIFPLLDMSHSPALIRYHK